jgi:pimeloyl-ACP methyl ester carboxylesterase
MSPHPLTGPIETALLRDLAPTFATRFLPAGGTLCRILEGGSGPPLILVHGRGHAATIWAPWLLPLAERYRVFALELPGFGVTPAGQLRPGGPEEGLDYFVAPLAAALAALQLAASPSPAQPTSGRLPTPIVIGHSLGGFVALELALRRLIAPRALILIGAMGLGPHMTYGSRAYFMTPPERLARTLGPDLFERISPLPDHASGRRLAALEYELATVPRGRPIPTAAFNRLFPLLGPAFHRLPRLPEVDAPTLLLWGDHDAAFPAPTALVAASAFPRARAKLFPLGHSPHLEEPEQVLAEVEQFLAELG